MLVLLSPIIIGPPGDSAGFSDQTAVLVLLNTSFLAFWIGGIFEIIRAHASEPAAKLLSKLAAQSAAALVGVIGFSLLFMVAMLL